MKRNGPATDAAILLLFAAFLIWPLFRLEYLDNWASIESTFIADARMLAEHLPHPRWQPLWYTGTRFDYIYPPALRYGTALISTLGGISTARAYHLYTAFYYVGGILAVYWLMLVGSRSRFGAWIAAMGTALISPCFLFINQLRRDSGFGAPQRLHVLMQHGEGPHIAALCVLPAALAAMWLALRERRPGMVAVSAALCALVVSNNFYGATALALLVPALVWAVWLGERNWRVVAKAAAIAALAWGLCAFWLTPGYVGITIANLRLVADPGDLRSAIIFVLALLLFGVLTFRLANRAPQRSWPVFCAGAAWIMALYVLGHHYWGLQVAGNTIRLAPELDLTFLLAFATGLVAVCAHPRWLTNRPLRLATGVVLLLALVPSAKYWKHLWSPFPESKALEQEYPRQITKWVEANLPGQRVLPAGEVRFWFNAWGNTAQPDGGSMQGMLNQMLPDALWQILKGDKLEPGVLWLQALGTDAVVVSDARSRDVYRGDFMFPEKFRALTALHDDGQGTVIYRIPRTYPGIGRVVDAKVLQSAAPIRGGDDKEHLAIYAGETEKPGRHPVSVEWRGFDAVRLRAIAGPGESILLQETWDSSWSAQENGEKIQVHRDPVMGFIVLPVTPGAHDIRLQFETPRENRIGQALTVLSLIIAGGLLWLDRP